MNNNAMRFSGPNTAMLRRPRLPENTERIPFFKQPEGLSKLINYLDQLTMYQNIEFYNAERLPIKQILDSKQVANQRLVNAAWRYEQKNSVDSFHKFVIEKAIGWKLHFWLRLSKAEIISKKLHKGYREKDRRMTIFLRIYHTHSCELFFYNNFPIPKYIDCFSQKACVIILPNKSAKCTLSALYNPFSFLSLPWYLWTDNVKQFVNRIVQSNLKRNNIHQYSTFSDLKACIKKRFNLTIRVFR